MDLLEIFRDSADLETYPAGTVILEEGSTGDLMFVVIDGSIELSLHGRAISELSAGDILGEMALLRSDVRSATAMAKSDCVLAPIDLHSFKSLIQHTPDFALHVMNVLAERLRRVTEALTGQHT